MHPCQLPPPAAGRVLFICPDCRAKYELNVTVWRWYYVGGAK